MVFTSFIFTESQMRGVFFEQLEQTVSLEK